MEALKQMIKNGTYNQIMLFHGPETFMLDFYLKKAVVGIIGDGDRTMNFDEFSDPKTSLDQISDSIETMPFFAGRRVVVLKNLDLCGKNKNSNDIAELLLKVPDTTFVIVQEVTIDKRKKIYKNIAKIGHIVEFQYLGESDLVKYIAKGLGKHNKKISGSDARYLIQFVGGDLTVMHNEIEKLASYVVDDAVVTAEAIDMVCIKSIESKIFELMECLGSNQREKALRLYHDLLLSKEPANRILFMLTRQFRMTYKAKLMSGEGLGQNDIAKKLKVQSFVVRKSLNQGKNFSLMRLEASLQDCLQTEIDIRTGVFRPELAVEQLIIKYSG